MLQTRLALTSLLLVTLCVETPTTYAQSAIGPPDGFRQVGLYMANGAFDLNEPHPQVPGCFQSFCDPQYFHQAIMGWTPAESLAEDLAAKDFFHQRFGLDVDTLVDEGRISFHSLYADPRVGYRLYSLAREKIPSSGWEIREGAYVVFITDPAGIDLGGEFSGVSVPTGTAFATGIYNIQKTLPNGRPTGEIIIRFKSAAPMYINADGSFLFQCEIEHPEWGSGLAQGISAGRLLADGRTQFNIRNVLTFPDIEDDILPDRDR